MSHGLVTLRTEPDCGGCQELHASVAHRAAILDSLSGRIALVAADGSVLFTNKAWRRFNDGERGVVEARVVKEGDNYLDACRDPGGGPCGELSSAVADGLEGILRGQRSAYRADYAVRVGPIERWFHVIINRFAGPDTAAIVSHEDITRRKRAEQESARLAVEARQAAALLRAIVDNIPAGVFWKDAEGRYRGANQIVRDLAGVSDMVGKRDEDLPWSGEIARQTREDDVRVMETGKPRLDSNETLALPGRPVRWLTTSKVPLFDGQGRVYGVLGTWVDVTERREFEAQLAQAQKLESVGRLAAGVAHEINTPVQFVSDSVHFVREGVTDLFVLLERLRVSREALRAGGDPAETLLADEEAEEAADLAYLAEHLPRALERSVEGLGRVADIVRSMKEFARGDSRDISAVDLNRAVQSTLVVARNEYKYVADVETELAELPAVTCHGGEINQVILNLVINAAHAIEDAVAGSDRRGAITVRTHAEGDHVLLSVSDTGTGIPEAIRERIFDPFFTTKDVGRGTGQGLALSRRIVVEQHGGAIWFHTRVGEGSTFFVRLPVDGRGRTRGAGAGAGSGGGP